MANQRTLFLKHLAPTSSFPLMLEIERGEGVYLYDTNGKAYLDLIAGISVSSLGHCHPKVVKAVQDQAATLMHAMVYGEYVLSPQVQLAKAITDLLPEQLNSVYFVNSGSEATEGAMKLAKRFTGRHEMISCYNAYHGSTQGSASLNSDSFFTQAYRPLLPGISHIWFNKKEDLANITRKTAAVVIETVQAESGVHPPKDDYLKALRKRCDEVGAMLIFDEIQVGYGRTGSFFAFEQYEVVPDILLLAKAMGGGMPIGAFVSDQKKMESLSVDPLLGHITTFGGHPVTCAAGLATLHEMLSSGMIQEVSKKAALIKSLLVHPRIETVRNAGLLMAVQFSSFDFCQEVIKYCLEKGLITDWFLFNDKCLRIAPPLIISEEEIRTACATILEAVETAHQKGIA